MSVLELAASVLTLASVVLAVRLKTSLYPVGLVATGLYLVVFWQARLFASAGLQVYFLLIQVYGWWYWRAGDKGRAPPIGDWGWPTVGILAVLAAAATAGVSYGLHRFTDANAPLADSAILALSVLAQFLLDRKQLKSWYVWGVVDVLSVVVYGSQGLWLTACLYAVLLVTVGFGWASWRAAAARDVRAAAA